MARPRKGNQKHRPKHLGFRVATWVYDGVHRLAVEHDQPASEVAHDLLEIALGKFGIKPERMKRPDADVPSRPPESRACNNAYSRGRR